MPSNSTVMLENAKTTETRSGIQKARPMLNALGIKRIKKRKEDFLALVEKYKDKKWYICSHDNPDPDSISCALGMARILECLDVGSVELVYCGEISHPQNKSMINVLNINLKRWTKQMEADERNERAKEKPNESVFLFVDCAGNNQNNMSIPFDPIAAIDHHKSIASRDVMFLHDEVGACATLIVDLGLSIPIKKEIDNEEEEEEEEAHIEDENYGCFNPNDEGTKELATALAIGIKTDTLDFRSEATTEFDFKAYKILSRLLSDDKFQKIVNYELPAYIFEAEEIAWKNKNKNCTPNLITYLGFLDETKSDCIPYLADKLMRLQGVQTVVVYGIVGDCVRGSVRTASSSIDAQTLCDTLFGEGNGGAKHGIGGASVKFSPFDPRELTEENKERVSVVIQSHVEAQFHKAMNA